MSLTSSTRFFAPISRLKVPAISRWRGVLILGGLSLLVYWLGLLLPYNLFTLQFKPRLEIGTLTRHQPAAQAGFVLTIALLAGLYYLAWRVCRGRQTRAMWLAVIASLLLINLSMLWLYPIGATDIFDNIEHGRIAAQYGANPFYDPPRQFAGDPFYPYVGWRDYPSAYGPLWELLAAGTSKVAGDGLLANILAFKLLNLSFYAGSVALIALMLKRRAPERALQGVCLFAWNPLVIYETVGNGHNDIVMVFFVVLGIYLLIDKRFTFAALAMIAGALIKFIPLLLLPIVFVAALRILSTWRQRIAFALGTIALGAIVVYLTTAPFWQGGDFFGLKWKAVLFTTSLPSVLQAQLQTSLGAEASRDLVGRLELILTGLAVLYAAWRTWRETDWLSPVRASIVVLLFYLLVASPWFQGWYAIWPLALAAILPEGALGRTAVLLSYAVFWKTIFIDFFLYRGPLPPLAVREVILAAFTLGLVWLYVAYAAVCHTFKSRLVERLQ